MRFDRTTAPGPAPAVLSETWITFLTLDVLSNLPNNPTFVPLSFWNESLATVSTTDPLCEFLISTSWEFVCWDQVQLSDINVNLKQVFQDSRKGIVRAGPAVKIENGAPNDDIGPVTLLGLIETIEGTAANSFLERKYNFNVNPVAFCVPDEVLPRPNLSPILMLPVQGRLRFYRYIRLPHGGASRLYRSAQARFNQCCPPPPPSCDPEIQCCSDCTNCDPETQSCPLE